MDKTNRKIIDSYVAIHDGRTFTLSHIPNGSIIVIKFSIERFSNIYSSFETFIISKYTDKTGAELIYFTSITNPVMGISFVIDVNKESIWQHYNPNNLDITTLNFGFDKKYLEIVAIYDRLITTLDNKKRDNPYKLYGWKKYELTPIFLREFKYDYDYE